ncbi:hypothetical protein [Paraburkholderia sp. UCT2]|uniref:hypothetical protein n=1 Tax=Paraburkholderia sp. UCT2 TaxID=2615208 RepID=UPI00165627BB|nr:hypothetical protein [Paraburkholderia sp. UCT2]MBC8726816.1 hypothetical protein [Paraburkholderia sp. UCT2]
MKTTAIATSAISNRMAFRMGSRWSISKGNSELLLDEIDRILLRLQDRADRQSAVIVCLCTGATLPDGCSPMPRDPNPATGMPLADNFLTMVEAAIHLNAAVHDGAIIVSRSTTADDYRIAGWSYRLHPLGVHVPAVANRGSAFNSCLAMSCAPGVDRVYLASKTELFSFRQGGITQF